MYAQQINRLKNLTLTILLGTGLFILFFTTRWKSYKISSLTSWTATNIAQAIKQSGLSAFFRLIPPILAGLVLLIGFLSLAKVEYVKAQSIGFHTVSATVAVYANVGDPSEANCYGSGSAAGYTINSGSNQDVGCQWIYDIGEIPLNDIVGMQFELAAYVTTNDSAYGGLWLSPLHDLHEIPNANLLAGIGDVICHYDQGFITQTATLLALGCSDDPVLRRNNFNTGSEDQITLYRHRCPPANGPCNGTETIQFINIKYIVQGEPPPSESPTISNDFLISTYDNKNIYSFAIYGDGTFGEEELVFSEPVASEKFFIGFAIADYDRDGDNDFVATRCSGDYTFEPASGDIPCYSGNDDGALWLFEQTNPGTFVTSTVLSSSDLRSGGFVAADFNKDGYLDLAGRVADKTGQIFFNQRNNTFGAGPTFTYANLSVGIQYHTRQYSAGDFNQDGYIDLAVSSYEGTGKVYTLNGDGNGNLATPVEVATTPIESQTTIVGYFNDDSYLDIIAGQDDDGDSGQAWVYFGNGDGTFVDNDDEAYDTNPGGGTNATGAGQGYASHLDGDGILDLVIVYRIQSSTNYPVEYWSGNGDGTFDKVAPITDETTLARPIYIAVPPTFSQMAGAVPFPQTWADNECPICAASEFSAYGADPVNTYSGNFNHQETDFSIPTLGPPLAFVRSYNSQATETYTQPLGIGWTHNYNIHLVISDVITAPVTLVGTHGSQFGFNVVMSGTEPLYFPQPGVRGDLVRSGTVTYTYTLTAVNQQIYTFNGDGQLVGLQDPLGNALILTYTNDLLTQVGDPTGSRYLQFDYNGEGRIITVTDSMGREVSFEYVVGNLVTATDQLELETTYTYSDSLLTSQIDPTNRVTFQNDYAWDTEDGVYRVITQTNGSGEGIYFSYGSGGMVTLTNDIQVDRRDRYSPSGVLAYQEDADGNRVSSANDSYLNKSGVTDPNGNITRIVKDSDGLPHRVTNALGNETAMSIDNHNNLTQVVNARSHTTAYAYDNASFPTFRTAVTDALGNTTIYTPTSAALDGVDGLLKAQRDPNGVVISYTYNTFGQVEQMVHGYGTTDAVTSTYGYDAVGRLITTTQTSALESHTSLNIYDDADRLIATIANWTGSDPAQWLNDCDTSGGERDTNICTRYKYDDAGRTISTTNTLNQTNLTFYDAAGRVVTSVVNYDGTTALNQLCLDLNNPDPEYNLCSLTDYDAAGRVAGTTDSLGHVSRTFYDSAGRVAGMVVNWQRVPTSTITSTASLSNCISLPANRDYDICTRYQYDPAGNTVVVTYTLNRMTRTFYDELNRVAGTVVNWRGELTSTITTTEGLQNCFSLPENRDYDICTLYGYDEVGNTIIVTDTLGRMTQTFYDELNRVKVTVSNWNADTLSSPADCNFSPGNTNTENICTIYGYDDAGNQITVTNALSQTGLTVYDEANRPVIQVANWDGSTVISADGTGCADTAANPTAEENLCTSFTGYDKLGRRVAMTDTLGLLTTFAYDGLGRVVTTTRFLDSQPVTSTTSYNAIGNRLSQTDARGNTATYQYDSLNRVVVTTSPEGVAITQTYNAAGWVITTTDSLGHSAVNAYDDLGRLITTTDALGNQTQYVYDALGNQVAMIDAEGVKTTYVYDDLNRLKQVIENDVNDPPSNENEEDVTTEYVYDALGNRVLVVNARAITFTQTIYDGLNRPVAVADALGITTTYRYDALGSRVVMTDGNGAVTQYAYDDLNRLRVTAYLSDSETISYSYNAAGNRLVMTDSLGVTSYAYDGFYRLISVTNPFAAQVQYGYDLNGNRTQLTYPDSKVVAYTYDVDNRLVQVEDWDGGFTQYDYDPAGRLISSTLPNAVQTIYSYDNANRLISLTHRDGGGNLLARFLYELDNVGNRITATETLATPDGSGLAMVEGGLTAEEVLVQVTGEGGAATADALLPHDSTLSKPAARPQDAESWDGWSAGQPTTAAANPILAALQMNVAERTYPQFIQGNPVANLTLRLVETTLPADGRSGTFVLVTATDADGQPVPDGTRISLQAEGGRFARHIYTTHNGVVTAWLTAGTEVGSGQVTVRAGQTMATAAFTLTQAQIEQAQLSRPTGEQPFDANEVIEAANNRIQTTADGRHFVERPGHRAEFDNDRVLFTPATGLEELSSINSEQASGSNASTLLLETISITIGSQSLLQGAATTTVANNIVTYERGSLVTEQFIAGNAGIEQQWQIANLPFDERQGDLVIAVEVQTELALVLTPGGEGFTFRAIDPATGEMTEVASYSRAVAIDANGDSIPANISFETINAPQPSSSSRLAPTTYRLYMTFPADWLAEAAFPILVDPLISSAVQLDMGGVEADQSQPAVAYNSADDEFLVVWQDDRNDDNDIFAQRVDGDGNLVGDNVTVNADSGNQTLPDVAYNPDQNSYLVVWRDGTEAIRGQAVENDGDLMGTVRNLADSAITRNYPTVSYSSSDNAWLVAWQEWDSGTSSYQIRGRAVKGSSGALQTAFTVYNNGSDSVTPDVSANGSGGFLVAWEQTVISDTDIYVRRAISTAVDGGTIVLTSTTDAQVAPAVTYNPDDDEFLVVWQDLADPRDTIWARQVTGITATNPFVGSAFQVNSGAFNAQAPAVTYFTPGVVVSGTYLVAWERPSGSDSTIIGQRVLTDTTKDGSGLTITPVGPNEPADVALGYGPTITATLAAWTSELGGHYDVAAARIPAAGSAGTVFVVHPQPDYQERPEVAYNSDDQEYLVVWHDYRAGEADPNIFGQRVSITGTLLGDNITITAASYRQLYPKVAYGDGVYLVAWTHYPGLSDTDFDAYAGIISPTGTVITNSLVISTGTAPNSQAQPTDIVYNSAAQQFLVLYQDKTVTQFNIWGRHVDSGGSMGGYIQVTSQNTIAETNAAGAYNPDDNHYLVVWEDTGHDLYGRRLTGAGVVSTTETITVANTTVTEEKPDVVYLNDQTGYVVVWSVSAGTSREVYGRVVAANGATGTTYQVSSGAQGDKLPRLDLDGEGGAMVIWHFRVNFDTDNLYGRRLGSDGQPLGGQFTILSMADTRQLYPALASNGDGQYFLAWQDDRNGNRDIYGQPFQHLTADFSANPTSGSAPLNVSFTDTSQPTGAADEWAWDFGDSGASASQNPNHTYNSAGLYTVTLTITDTNTGETDTVIKTNYISVTTGTTSLITTTIVYTYDNLYRLTEATYSGGITATYDYQYDAVGNMTYYTETVAAETTRVNRSFNDANELIAALDVDDGTTSYYYDGNGNLVEILPPGATGMNPVNGLRHGYNQRNLMITNTLYISGTGWVAQADFDYDGMNNRLRQVDYTGMTTTTITYTNDILGLSQVLVADNGTEQVVNLFGLDLIHQDDSSETRTLLADGLGSVRLEMMGAGVETATTYSPYGDTLAQSGTSGTTYGFTGEQEDASTGLLYLRARYYSSNLRVFMGRDSWRGNNMRPITFNGYVYGYNSPPNFTDPSGYKPIECPTQNCSPIPDLVEFTGAGTESWTADEQYQVNKAVKDIGWRLAKVYNEYEYGYLLPPDLAAEIYGACASTERPLTPSEAFLYYYGKPALFYKTGTVNDPLSYGEYGITPNGVGINVYRYPRDTGAYLADPTNYPQADLVYRIDRPTSGYRWATHELGHYFEARINNLMGISRYVRDYVLGWEIRTRRGLDNDVNSYGFAGTLYGWQQSPENTTGEEFADMFLGWTYNEWETDPTDTDPTDGVSLTELGQTRADFMDRHMAQWIALVINREKNKQQ